MPSEADVEALRAYSAKILKDEEDRKEAKKEEARVRAKAKQAENLAKGQVVPPKPLSSWERENQSLEEDGLAGLGRSAEEVVVGEKRKDWNH